MSQRTVLFLTKKKFEVISMGKRQKNVFATITGVGKSIARDLIEMGCIIKEMSQEPAP